MSAPTRPASPRERIVAFVDRAYDSLAEVDYYRVLGVSSASSAEHIRAAYYKLATYLHPDIHGTDLEPAFHRKLTAVYSRVVEAYKVLTDDTRRRAYDVALAGGSMRLRSGRTTAPAPRPEDRIQNPKARRFFELSRAALRDHDLKSARTNLKLALMMEPGSPLIEEELAKLEPPGG